MGRGESSAVGVEEFTAHVTDEAALVGVPDEHHAQPRRQVEAGAGDSLAADDDRDAATGCFQNDFGSEPTRRKENLVVTGNTVERHPARDGVETIATTDILDTEQQVGAAEQRTSLHRS